MPPSFERLRREGFADDDHRHASTMRSFLEDPTSFRWPENLGNVDSQDPTVCVFENGATPESLLVWERHLNVARKGGKVWLEQRRFSSECQDSTKFRRRFVVKGYVSISREQMVEAANMKGLRHPHVAALLGTCSIRGNFWILSYPPGCCDLGDYMASISHELGGKHWRGREWKLELQRCGEEEVRAHLIHHEYCWPFRESLGKKLTRLRGYFICLAQALDYLQSADIRHRDLKPDNIIIDLSGSVVVIDFGLSHKFPPNTTQESESSSTQREFIVYQAPEVLEGDLRGPPSEIFSLGCIYMEMASLILGRNLQICSEQCSFVINQDGRKWDYGCSENLSRATNWIHNLKTITQPATGDKFAPSPADMISRLDTIERMLSQDSIARPRAHELWAKFDVPEGQRCRDCHPKHPDVWRPTQDQFRAAIDSAVDLTMRSVTSQYNDLLRESHELTNQPRRAGFAREPLVRLSSPARTFTSPPNSPRRSSIDQSRVRSSSSPVVAQSLSPRREQKQQQRIISDRATTIASPVNELSALSHQYQYTLQNQSQVAARPSALREDRAGQKSFESLGASSNAWTLDDPKSRLLEVADTMDEGFVWVNHDTEALTPIKEEKEEKRVQFKDEPPSVIPALTTREDPPNSSGAGDEGQSIPLTPETGALVIWPARESQPMPLSRRPLANPIRQMPVEKIVVYDAAAEAIFTNTTRILSGRDPSQSVGFELPATGSKFHVYGENSELLFILDLSRLDSVDKIARRLLASYQSIYIINFQQKPILLVDRKRDRSITPKVLISS